jgi:hypothetical protein
MAIPWRNSVDFRIGQKSWRNTRLYESIQFMAGLP